MKLIIGIVTLCLYLPALSQEIKKVPTLLNNEERLQDYLMNHLLGISNGYKSIEMRISRSGKVLSAYSGNVFFSEDNKFAFMVDSLDRDLLLNLQFFPSEQEVSLKVRLYMLNYGHSVISPVTECARLSLSAINALRILFENENDEFKDSRTGKELDYVVHHNLIILRPSLRMALE